MNPLISVNNRNTETKNNKYYPVKTTPSNWKYKTWIDSLWEYNGWPKGIEGAGRFIAFHSVSRYITTCKINLSAGPKRKSQGRSQGQGLVRGTNMGEPKARGWSRDPNGRTKGGPNAWGRLEGTTWDNQGRTKHQSLVRKTKMGEPRENQMPEARTKMGAPRENQMQGAV